MLGVLVRDQWCYDKANCTVEQAGLRAQQFCPNCEAELIPIYYTKDNVTHAHFIEELICSDCGWHVWGEDAGD